MRIEGEAKMLKKFMEAEDVYDNTKEDSRHGDGDSGTHKEVVPEA